MVFFAVLLPAALFTVRVTTYLCTGFLAVEVLLLPKFQDQEVGDPVLLSAKATPKGAYPEIGEAEKAAIIFY